MRYHRRGRACVLRHDPAIAAEMFRAENLAVARLEPALSNREEAILDLVFERGGRFAVLPMAIVDSAFIIGRESSPFAWPASSKVFLDAGTLRALESRIEPWLRTRLLARSENDEAIRYYTETPLVRDAFEHARRLGLCGAAPFAQVLTSIAPAVYAYRFAMGGSVVLPDRGYANAAAVLYGRANRVDLPPESNDSERFERNWFSTQLVGTMRPDATYDVAIIDDETDVTSAVQIRRSASSPTGTGVAISQPIPLATFVSFDPDDSIEESELRVVVKNRSNVSRVSSVLFAPPVGGSGGRIALLVREDWSRADDADSDAIRTLAQRLSAEGFAVRIIEGWSNLEPPEVDLVHIVGLAHAPTIRAKVERLRDAGIPIVTMPLVDDPKGETAWGVPLAQSAFRNSVEDTTLDHYLTAIAARRLNADGVPSHHLLPLPPNADAIAVLNCSGALIASTASEVSLIRERFGYQGPVSTVAPILRTVARADVDAIAGFGDFVLMHTAIDARSAVVMAVLACEAESLPVVLSGPVADAETMLFLHAFAGDFLRYLPSSSIGDGQLEELYARARVYADISWSGRGLNRLARAGGYGASLVASESGNAGALWGDAVHLADPGSLPSISLALRKAWDVAPRDRARIAARTALVCDQRSALSGTVQAYQQASSLLAVT